MPAADAAFLFALSSSQATRTPLPCITLPQAIFRTVTAAPDVGRLTTGCYVSWLTLAWHVQSPPALYI